MAHRSLIQAITFSGPSGSGKSATARALLDICSDIELVKGYTTRRIRKDELAFPVRHREYHYISHEEFDARDSRGEFEWKVELDSGRYATPKRVFERQNGGVVLFLVTPDTVSRIHTLSTGYVRSFFFFPPPKDEIISRMRDRGDNEDEIRARLVDSRNPSWIKPLRDGSIDWIPVVTKKRDFHKTADEILQHLGMQ